MSKPGLASLAIFTFVNSWKSFFWPLIVTATDNYKTLPLGLYTFSGQYGTDWSALMAATGKNYSSDPAIYTKSSPVTFVNSQSPPTIAFQGGLDFVVTLAQTNILITKLNSVGVPNQLVFYPNEGHGFSQANNTDALTRTTSFILNHVK